MITKTQLLSVQAHALLSELAPHVGFFVNSGNIQSVCELVLFGFVELFDVEPPACGVRVALTAKGKAAAQNRADSIHRRMNEAYQRGQDCARAIEAARRAQAEANTRTAHLDSWRALWNFYADYFTSEPKALARCARLQAILSGLVVVLLALLLWVHR